MIKFFKFAIFLAFLNLVFADTAPNLQKPKNPQKVVKNDKNSSNLENNKSEFNLTNYKIPIPINLNQISPKADKNETNGTANLSAPNLEAFESLNFNMPSDAAILNQIIVRYTDGTGALKEKILDINKTINWQHDFSVLSRQRPNLSKAIDVSVTSKDPNLKENSATSAVSSLITPQFELPIETLKFDDELKFIIKNRNIRLVTQDSIKSNSFRNGILKVEFFRMEIPLSKVNFRVNKGGFSDINVTRNDGFYTLEIGSQKGNLTIEKIDGGYEVFIR